jgi:hypothetical protein
MVFRNDQANIGPIIANLNQTSLEVYAVTGGYLSQPGQWDVSMAAQRLNDYDLNYKLTLNVTAAAPATPSSVTQTGNTSIQEVPSPKLDSFALFAIGLAIVVGIISAYSYKRSNSELRKIIQMLEAE